MKRTTLLALKTLVWLACLWPLGLLLWAQSTTNWARTHGDHHLCHRTGHAAPAHHLAGHHASAPSFAAPRLAHQVSPLLGLFAFFYATLHLLTYVALYAGFDVNAMAADIAKRRYITAGVTAWLLLLPLAATSTNWAIRKLGGKRWNRLHMLVYAAAVCGVIHYWWQVKPGVLTPLAMTIVLGILLLARPVQAWNQRRKVHLV